MDPETVKMSAVMLLERELEECKKAKCNEEIKKNKKLYGSLLSMEKDLKDLLEIFNEHTETFKMKGRIRGLKAKGKRKVIEARLVKKAFTIRNKYKNEMKEMNEILGD